MNWARSVKLADKIANLQGCCRQPSRRLVARSAATNISTRRNRSLIKFPILNLTYCPSIWPSMSVDRDGLAVRWRPSRFDQGTVTLRPRPLSRLSRWIGAHTFRAVDYTHDRLAPLRNVDMLHSNVL